MFHDLHNALTTEIKAIIKGNRQLGAPTTFFAAFRKPEPHLTVKVEDPAQALQILRKLCGRAPIVKRFVMGSRISNMMVIDDIYRIAD